MGLVFLGLLGALAQDPAVWHVAPDGSDANGDGSAARPFATPQKGVDAARPGDTVRVRAGFYRATVTFPRSGAATSRITLEGEPGATLDGGVVVTGWEPDPERGASGVYRKNAEALPFPLYHMTWNGKYVLRLNAGQDSLKTPEAYYARLTAPPEDRSWDGVEAFFGTRDGYAYVRFRNKEDPNREKITFGKAGGSRGSGVVNLPGVSFITVRGFTLQGGGDGVHVSHGAHDNLIEDNFIVNGRNGVLINGQATTPVPCHRNVVRRNRITLNYVDDLSPRNPRHGHIWKQFKEASDTDRRAVYLYYAGDDNRVHDNTIYQHWDGVQDSAGGATREEYASFSRRLKVYNNTIRDMGDDALEPTGGEIDAEWNDNLLENALIGIRIKDVKTGPCYIYRNRSASGPKASEITPRDLFYFAGSDGAVYLYHNTFASGTGLMMGSTTPERGAPNLWFLNNVFSNERFWVTTPKWSFDAHAHHNWVGGDARRHAWMSENNIFAEGVRLWDAAKPDFLLHADSPAREKGLDLSKPVLLEGKTFGPLPGMEPGYFSGARPDLGAVQFRPR